MTTATKPRPAAKPTEATRFSYAGEFIDVPPALGYPILAEYAEAAKALHVAKQRAFALEEKIKELMGGHENLRVDDEVKVTWKWGKLVRFHKRELEKAHPEIVAKFTETVMDGKRTFSAKGVVGVE